ncbi:MAG: hypothetical protein WBR18_08380 [Anaerolineales bacterium]
MIARPRPPVARRNDDQFKGKSSAVISHEIEIAGGAGDGFE